MKNKLLSQFNALPEDEQTILLALAVILIPIGQTTLLQLLKSSGCVDAATANKVAAPLKARLSKTDLVEFGSDGWRCNEGIADELMKIAVKKEVFFNKLATAVLSTYNPYISYRLTLLNDLKQLRIFLYQGKVEEFTNSLNKIAAYFPEHLNKIFDRLFFNDFDEQWFSELHEGIRFVALKYYLSINQEKLTDCSLQYQLLEKQFSTLPDKVIRHTLIEYRLLRGNFENVEEWLAKESSAQDFKLLGALRFLQNRNNDAIECFERCISETKKETRKRNIVITGLYGQFYHLALLKSRNAVNLNVLKKQLELAIKNYNDSFNQTNFRLLDGLMVYQAQTTIDKTHYLLVKQTSKINPYEQLFQALLLYWLDGIELILKIDKSFLSTLTNFCKQAHQFGYKWYAVVSALLLDRLGHADKQCLQIAALYKGSPLGDIIDLLPRVETWERALNALAQLNAIKKETEVVNKEARLIWLFSLNNDQFSLMPREQKLGKNGRWTKGKAIALKRLKEDLVEFDYLTEQDRQICMRIEVEMEYEYYGYRPKEVYVLG